MTVRRPTMPIGAHGAIHYSPAPRGGWRARTRYRSIDGTVIPREKTGRTKTEAKNLLLADLSDEARGRGSETLNSESTMRDLADEFFARLALEGEVIPRTIRNYQSHVEDFVTATEGVRLREVTPSLIENRLLRTTNKNRAARTRQLLTRMFNLAVLHDAVQVNPVTSTTPVRVERPERIETLSDDDIDVIRDAVQKWAHASERPGPRNHDMVDLFEVLLATGIRIGEALALRWSDLVLEGPTPTLEVTGQVVYRPGQGNFRQTTKTRNSLRVFVLPKFAASVLRTRKMLMPPNDLDAVFVTRTGNWHAESNMQRRLQLVRQEAGLEWVKFHTFRRTVATEIGNTLSSQEAADQLGHGSTAVTERHYIEKKRRVVDVSNVLQDRFAKRDDPGLRQVN